MSSTHRYPRSVSASDRFANASARSCQSLIMRVITAADGPAEESRNCFRRRPGIVGGEPVHGKQQHLDRLRGLARAHAGGIVLAER